MQYVKDKKTVVFCDSVFDAEEVAKLFKKAGVKAEAASVSGNIKSKYRDKILKNYENGDIQVLCACDLLNEGWDSPKTQVYLWQDLLCQKQSTCSSLDVELEKQKAKTI